MLTSILSKLPSSFPWRDSILYFDTIDSTNTKAKEMAAQGAPHGTVLLADRQTGGRGRMGRSFHSPGGKGIYLSVILRPHCQAAQLLHLTCAMAVAACNAIESAENLRPGIKWTNDLVFEKKKLGGILTELSLRTDGSVEYAVAGVGINCSQTSLDFPEEIRSIATSLSAAVGHSVDREKIAANLILQLQQTMDTVLTQKNAIMDRYRRDCITIGKEISVCTPTFVRHGTAIGVDDDGALLVAFPEGHTEAVNSGEVSIRGMYGYL